MVQAKKQTKERAAFSPLCPSVEEVKTCLQELGFHPGASHQGEPV